MVNRFGIVGFLCTKLLLDCSIEHLRASGLVHFFVPRRSDRRTEIFQAFRDAKHVLGLFGRQWQLSCFVCRQGSKNGAFTLDCSLVGSFYRLTLMEAT